jgi:hypothetical protein
VATEFDTTDGYTEASSLRLVVPVRRITITVQNAGATAKFIIPDTTLRASAQDFNTSEFPMIPGVWTWEEKDFNDQFIAGVTLRSSAAGNPAHIIILAGR